MTTKTLYYLEMNSPGELNRAKPAPLPVKVIPTEDKELFESIVDQYGWPNHTRWTENNLNLHHYIVEIDGAPAGTVKLIENDDGSVRISIFGLLNEYIGHGYGGDMLNQATDMAWNMTDSRVWLHTSSNDHPNALKNYQARGFRLFKTEEINSETDNVLSTVNY